MEKKNEGLFQTKTSKEYEDAWNTIWDAIGTEDEFKSLKDIRSFIYSRPKRFPKLNADVDKYSMRLWQAYKLNTDIEYETGLKDYDQPLYGDLHHSEPVYTESNKSSRKKVAENAGRRIASTKVKHSVWGFDIDWCRNASKAIADAIGADAYDLFLDDDDYDTIILKYDGKVPLTPEQKMKARETLVKVVGEKDLELSQSKSLNESYNNDTRTSVKVEFYGRDSDEVEDIVADVNEIHNTTFFAHELGKRVFVESGTLFTSVAKLEDILEEFLSRGASEIRFIKA